MPIDPYSITGVDSLFKQLNPNQIAPGNAAGLGSGNPISNTANSFYVSSFTNNFPITDEEEPNGNTGGDGGTIDEDGNGSDQSGTTYTAPSQDPLEILKGYFPDADETRLQELSKFVSVIPTEIYEAADPNAEMYQLMRQERFGQLEGQRDIAETSLRSGLFRNLEQARGMEGKRGFALGRNIYGDVSEDAAQRFEGVQSEFSRGLYNINQSIIDKISSAQRYLASLESQQRSDILKLADLADLISPSTGTSDPYIGTEDPNAGQTDQDYI